MAVIRQDIMFLHHIASVVATMRPYISYRQIKTRGFEWLAKMKSAIGFH